MATLLLRWKRLCTASWEKIAFGTVPCLVKPSNKRSGIKREAIRVKLLELGYAWKRTRYAPGKQADPEVVAKHQASLETLKRGR